MSETVYWVNGRCYSCGSAEVTRRGVYLTCCGGCGREIGTSLWTRTNEAQRAAQQEGEIAESPI